MCPASHELKGPRRKRLRAFLIRVLSEVAGALAVPAFGQILKVQESSHLRPAAISKSNPCGARKESAMKKLLVAGLIAGTFISIPARAQERAGDAALGALSGAVVLGPVGAVAGALIGFTAGPSIANSWGVRRSASRPRVRRATQSSLREPGTREPGTQEQAAVKVSSVPAIKTETVGIGKATPPPQGFE